MQMGAHPAMAQGGFYIQHAQAAAMAQQQGIFPPKMPLQFNNPHQMQNQQQQLHQQAIQAQMGIRPGEPSNGMHPIHHETNLGVGGSGGPPATSNQNDRNKQQHEASEVGPSNADGQGSSAGGHVGVEGSDEGK